MAIKIRVPYHNYEQIREIANGFLSKYNHNGTIPVPIEEIVEFSLHLNIIPIPGLQDATEVESFISSDLTCINIDKFILEKRVRRYRFSLAHEIGHLVLHKDIFAEFKFDSIEGWKRFQTEIDSESYGWMESQAYSFGGLVLAPREALASRKRMCEERIEREGLDPHTEAAQFLVCDMLAGEFNVSKPVIDKRLQRDA